MRFCPRCRQDKPTDQFYQYSGYCKPCTLAYAAEWRRKHPENLEKVRARAREWARRNPEKVKANRQRRQAAPQKDQARRKVFEDGLRSEVYTRYGNRCVCCGETEPIFLSIDHVNNDGAKDRKNSINGVKLWRKIRNLGFPSDYQILCRNCNWAKYALGECPHNKVKAISVE